MTVAYLRRAADAAATIPALVIYVAAVATAAAVAGRAVRLDVGVVILGVFTVMVIQAAMHREVTKVHVLVNSQRDELVAHIQDLKAQLAAARAQPPDDEREGPGGDRAAG